MKPVWTFLLALAMVNALLAIDVSPSKRVVPEDFTNPKGKKFSIFSGDPERVQRANEVKVQDFEGSLEFSKKEYSVAQLKNGSNKNPILELLFRVENKADRSYTLSFPDAQRYDIMIQDPKGEVIYMWSEDKTFVKEVGKLFVNKQEKVTFTPDPPVEITPFLEKLQAGTYKVTVILSNYSEIRAQGDWVVKP